MREKVPPLFYIFSTCEAERMSLSDAFSSSKDQAPDAFEGNKVHLLLRPQTGQRQITENMVCSAYFFSTNSWL